MTGKCANTLPVKLTFLKGGRFAHPQASEWGSTYLERLAKWHDTQSRILKETEMAKALSGTDRRVVLLDGRGKALSTEQLAKEVERWRDDGRLKEVVIGIGGSYGFSDEERSKAQLLWSLGPATLPGDIAWVVAVEQIYRAVTILEKHPYHHGRE